MSRHRRIASLRTAQVPEHQHQGPGRRHPVGQGVAIAPEQPRPVQVLPQDAALQRVDRQQ
ncbi:MAG: hypothetical protein JZU52_14440 [Lamprocystis purpurea]|uniref:hypothetical protein n=1 Tax=Lamprocystis purpurea TaxID=61598 RepID=UPI0012F828C2|nr:hypothetical protein [Lamprocystis purpurea]MBV5274779.1 hypothetical protein [Lamprocystis purpurea]